MKRFLITFIIASLIFSSVFFLVDKFLIDKEVTVDGEVVENKVPGEILVLLLGVDDEGLAKDKGVRTDTIMLAKANFETGKIDILSIPRDTRVPVKGKEDKINHAHSYGGVDLAKKTIEDFLHIDLNYYVKIDFDGIKEVVDAIGGVTIDVPVKMRHDLPRINLDPGVQLLDGQKAHDYLRFRSYPDGDIGRVHAQQVFMKEFAKELLSPKNILKMDKLIKTYYDYVETNIPVSTMLKYGISAGNLDIDNIRTEMVPGRFIELYPNGVKVSYWEYDMMETDILVEDMFGEYRKY